MKLNIKNLLIIFLVALLGGACGSYGVISFFNSNDETIKQETPQENIVSTIKYQKENDGIYASAIEKAYDTVVQITTSATISTNSFFGMSTQNVSYLGSGVIISEDGYIVTNQHVIEGANDVSICLSNEEVYSATIIGSDAKSDLALLKIEANNLPYSTLIDSDQLVLGDEVIAIGNGLGKGISCSNGIISALNREITISNYNRTVIVTNAEINEGNSGGGLFDLEGNLVGIVDAKTSSSSYFSETTVEGMGYAIPANTVSLVIQELLDNGYVKSRPALGVKIYTDSSFYSYYQLEEGLVISEVLEDSSAQKAGLMANDIILAIDDIKIESFSQMSDLLDNYKVGDTISITIKRNGKQYSLPVTLQESTQG